MADKNMTTEQQTSFLNWRNRDEYPESDDGLSLEQWKWEFLRRNKEYKAAWDNRNTKTSSYIKYDLYGWADPNTNKAPKFCRSCNLVEFNATNELEMQLHYYALKEAQRASPSIFSVNFFEPIEPQLNAILDSFKKWQKNFDEEERAGRVAKKNNSRTATKYRSRTLLLRVLDAHNSGVKTPEILNVLAEEDPEVVGESAMRRTITYAKSFWKAL